MQLRVRIGRFGNCVFGSEGMFAVLDDWWNTGFGLLIVSGKDISVSALIREGNVGLLQLHFSGALLKIVRRRSCADGKKGAEA